MWKGVGAEQGSAVQADHWPGRQGRTSRQSSWGRKGIDTSMWWGAARPSQLGPCFNRVTGGAQWVMAF